MREINMKFILLAYFHQLPHLRHSFQAAMHPLTHSNLGPASSGGHDFC